MVYKFRRGGVGEMKRFNFSGEILSLFFIITIAFLFGKVLLDIKEMFGLEISELEKNNIPIEYDVISHRENKRIETMKDLTIIRTPEDLRYFVEVVKKSGNDAKWLRTKLNGYSAEYFKTKTLVVISIVNDNNVSLVRVSNLYKNEDTVHVQLTKKVKKVDPTSKYTWFALIEIEDVDSAIEINFEEGN